MLMKVTNNLRPCAGDVMMLKPSPSREKLFYNGMLFPINLNAVQQKLNKKKYRFIPDLARDVWNALNPVRIGQ